MILPKLPADAKWRPTGSTVICDPPPDGTDVDFVVLEKTKLGLGLEWQCGTEYNNEYPPQFRSYRRGNVNLIVTGDEEFYNRFIAATHVAKRLNLLKKVDRIALFQAVLYGNCWEEPSSC